MKNVIVCPHCGKEFDVDGAQYESIVSQIRNAEFENELHKRLEMSAKEKTLAVESAKNEMSQIVADLQAKIDSFETTKALAVATAKEQMRLSQENQMEQLKAELTQAKIKMETFDSQLALAKSEAAATLANEKMRFETILANEKDTYEKELKLAQEETAKYKDFKARQSTKAIGESLEIYCYNEFNKVRNVAYPYSYFEKDNEVSKESGSKGDFIFREWIDPTTKDHELISIMFECKNEADTTDEKARHTNESFLKELDKDRREKGCEYAVLVSMLEGDNDYYNQGIVDVSYKYPKMYVIRPQFLLVLISMLVSAARNTSAIRHELMEIQNENRDYRNFESNLLEFKDRLSRNVTNAQNNYTNAMAQIDKAIADLEKTREFLRKANSQYDTTLRITESMDIPTLTKDAPTVLAQINEVREEQGKELIQAKRTRKSKEE